MADLVPLILHHHERYDGKGYPAGLKDDQIPLGSRIIALADSLDAMTSHRPYKNPYPFSKALNEIDANSGSQFDPQVVNVFLSAISNGHGSVIPSPFFTVD
ncbi:HD-GYP domain-containing protein [Caldanaerobius fijiensis]|uniref:HD-GYP domain-containing protein n=1 Tax=Caldanaerobius fijiensis TaxID=456330 RepID=UPI00228675A8|nr:HD domain-containing phosphohydrolase [Caldanaerobius fijiensis]